MGLKRSRSEPSRRVWAKRVCCPDDGGMVVLLIVLVLVLVLPVVLETILRWWLSCKRRTAMTAQGLEVKKALASHRVIYHCLFRGSSLGRLAEL